MLYDKTPTDRVLHIHLHRGKYMQDASPEAKRIMVEKAYKLAIGKTSWGFAYCSDYWYHIKNTHPVSCGSTPPANFRACYVGMPSPVARPLALPPSPPPPPPAACHVLRR